MRRRLPSLLITLLAACSGEVAIPPTTVTTGSGGTGGAALAITGTFIDTWLTDAGDLLVPRDPSHVALSAMVLRPDGGWDTYPGTLEASGQFVIPGVPLGTSHVIARKVDEPGPTEVWVTAERSLALGAERLGRPDATWPEHATPVVLDLAGTEGWDLEHDTFCLASRGTGGSVESLCPDGLADCFPVAGPLVDAARGDRIWFFRYAHGGSSLVLAGAFSSDTFTQHDGVPATLSGVVTPLPVASLSIAYDPAALIEALEAPGGTATMLVARVDEDRRSAGLARGFGQIDPSYPGSGLIDVPYGVLSPADAPLRASLDLHFAAFDPMSALAWGAGVVVTGPLDAVAQATLRPVVSAPYDVQIAGEPAPNGTVSGVGESPTISWRAPAIGAPDEHELVLLALPYGDQVLRLHTRDTQATLPPGLLGAGSHQVQIQVRQADPLTQLSGAAWVAAGAFTP